MPEDLPSPTTATPIPSFWLDRTQAQAGLPQLARTDAAFAVGGMAPSRLVSLLDSTPAATNAFTPASRLASYDPTGKGLHPYVPLIYAANQSVAPSIAGTAVLGTTASGAGLGLVDIPGTRFVPKVLITNDPGPGFTPSMGSVAGTLTTNIGRVELRGQVYESDAQGKRSVHDITGTPTGFESAGDLRTVAMKVVSFDTQSLSQDSRVAVAQFNNTLALGQCLATAAGSCLDDPAYQLGSPFNDYPRIVYPDSTTLPRCTATSCGIGRSNENPTPQTGFNPISPGFQAAGYLAQACAASASCERPVATAPLLAYYAIGEQPKPGANPNALSSSLVWKDAKPGANSIGRFEFFASLSSNSSRFATPLLTTDSPFGAVAGLTANNGQNGVTYKIGASLTQTPGLTTFTAPTPSRVTLSINHGIAAGAGITVSTDGTNAFKSSLPSPNVGATDSTSAPTFSTITPTLLSVSAGRPALTVSNSPGAAQVGSSNSIGDTLNGLQTGPANADTTPAATTSAAQDESLVETGPLLVLGGRGLAQSVDLGRSGGLGARPSSARADHEVACTANAAPRQRDVRNASARRAVPLPPCR